MNNLTWIDYIVLKNPQGAMKVLDKYGYKGYLAPQNIKELSECARLLIKENTEATEEFLKQHPEYPILTEVYKKSNNLSDFNNFNNNNKTNEVENKLNVLMKEIKNSKNLQNILLIGFIIIVLSKIFK